MTTSVFELIDKALDHLYTVNNVLPDTVDDEVIEELGNAIEICEKGQKYMNSVLDRIINMQSNTLQGKTISVHDITYVRIKLEYMSKELDMIKKCIVVCIDVKNPDMKQDFLEDEVNNIDKLIKKLGEVESD